MRLVRRFTVVAVLSSLIVFLLPDRAFAAACPWGTQCLSVIQVAPANGAVLKGTVPLETKAKVTQPARGPVYKVEWWLYHPSFKEQVPQNEEGKILMAETLAPSSGTSMDGVWRGSWPVAGSVTTRDGAYNLPGTRTYTLSNDGRQYKVESHVLDQEWTRTWGGPPGRSAPANVTMDFGGTQTPPPPSGCSGYQAEYFSGVALASSPVLSQCETTVNHNWPGAEGPVSSFGGSNFSARYTRSVSLTAGSYKFDVTSDDGVRVKVDGTTIIDQWSDHGATPYTATVSLAAGTHSVVVEYYERWGNASIVFSYIALSGPPSPPVTCSGYSGVFYTGISLSGASILTRCDAALNFTWGSGSPAPSVPVDQWSARWTSTRQFVAGLHKFTVTSDDGVRIKIDGVTVLDKWIVQGPTTYVVDSTLTAGDHTIVVEYYENAGGSTLQFSYTAPVATSLSTTGRWSVAGNTPLRSVHATLLSNGKVLLIAGSGNDPAAFAAGTFRSSVWDPVLNTYQSIPTPADLFCSGHVTLSDGKLLVAGGTLSYPGVNGEVSYRGAKFAYVFDPITNQYTRTNDTIEGHWYPTLTKLENGAVWAAGGYSDRSGPARSTEMFSNGRWLNSTEVPQTGAYMGTYPHAFLMADGRLFYTGGHTFGGAYPGTGAFIHDWRTRTIGDIPGLRDKGLRDQAGSVLLPPAQDQKFLITGGGSTDSGGTTAKTDIVDLKQSTPSYSAGPDLPGGGRIYPNLTTLPDRTVLVSNGGTSNRSGNVQSASVYSPQESTWSSVAPDPVGRNYHSASLLLPDGRVVTFGGNPLDGSFESRVSVYEPTYLFKTPRPVVSSAPSNLGYGQSFSLGVSGSSGTVVSVLLTSAGSATHQTDTNARAVDLPITGSGDTRNATVPSNSALLPPGPYMLTVMDDKGIPSVAKWVWVA